MTPTEQLQLSRNYKRTIKHKKELEKTMVTILDTIGLDGLNHDGGRRYNDLVFRINGLSNKEISLKRAIDNERKKQQKSVEKGN